MNIFNTQNILTKKEKKILVTAVLLSLVHNFIIFPAQAASYDEVPLAFTQSARQLTIKHPETTTNNLEQFSAKKTAITAKEPALNFKLVPKPVEPKEKTKATRYAISSLNESEIPAGKSMVVTMTAYNSEVAQTDGDPCTTANGFNVCKHGIEDTVAANFLPLGTKVMIPDHFGGRVFVVRDRTARKYGNRVDVWMLKKSDALQFGKRQLRVVVLAN